MDNPSKDLLTLKDTQKNTDGAEMTDISWNVWIEYSAH